MNMGWLQLLIAALELPSEPGERRFWSRLLTFQLIYSLAGLLVGLACVIAGVVLFLHGVTGSSSWVGEVIGARSKLSDAAPGTVLFIVGMLIVAITRFEIRIPDRRRRRQRAEGPERRRKAS